MVLRRPFIALLVLAFSIISSRSVWGQVSDITPNLEVSTRDDFNSVRSVEDSTDVTNSFFTRQTHFLILDIPINPVLLFSYNMRYTDIDNRTDFRDEDGVQQVVNTSDDTFEPQGELIWTNPYFEWTNSYRIRTNDNESAAFGVTRTEDNITSIFTVNEGPRFPRVDMQYEWFRNSDNLLTPRLDSNENDVSLDMEKSLGPARIRYEFNANRADNDISRLIEDRIDHSGQFTYSQSFFNNLVFVSGDYEIDATRRVNSRPPLTGTAELDFVVERETDRGLFRDGDGNPDATPANPLDDDLNVSVPDLIDGDTASSTGTTIDLKTKLQNIGVRLQVSESVDTIYVYIIKPPTVSEATLESITWTVYVGTASNSWTALAGVTVDFNVIESRFEFSIPVTTGRFFRVRNEVGSGTVENILVTEMVVGIQASGQEEFRLKQRQVRESYDQDLTTRVTLQPFRFLSISHDLFYSKANIDPEDAEDIERSNAGTLTFAPHPILEFSARAQRSYTDLDGDENAPDVEDLYTAVLSSVFLPTLTQSITFSRREEEEKRQVGMVDMRRNDSFLYNLTAEVYRNLTLGWIATWDRSWDFEENTPSTITVEGLFSVNAVLRRDLKISGDYAYGWVREGPLRAQRRLSEGDFIISYRPTPRINSQAEYSFIDEGNNRGLEQNYRIVWTAFTGGALDCTVSFELLKDTGSNELERQGSIAVTWKPRRAMQLVVDYTGFREDIGLSRTERRTVSGIFTWSF